MKYENIPKTHHVDAIQWKGDNLHEITVFLDDPDDRIICENPLTIKYSGGARKELAVGDYIGAVINTSYAIHSREYFETLYRPAEINTYPDEPNLMQREYTREELNKFAIADSKRFRVSLDKVLQQVKNSGPERISRERSIAITKIQEAIMWLGMDLKDLGNENPYPNSFNPDNTIVDKTADNLIL